MRLEFLLVLVFLGSLSPLATANAFFDETVAWDARSTGQPWIRLTRLAVNFPADETFLTVTLPFRREVQARKFRFLLVPRSAQIASVTVDDELLRNPEDAAGTIFPTASGEQENFAREIKVTFTRVPSQMDMSAVLTVAYQQ